MDLSSSRAFLPEDPLAELRAAKLRQLAQGAEVLDLSMINPDLAPPRYLTDRLMELCNRPSSHRYAVSRGIAKLRQAFAAKYRRSFDVGLNPDTEICAAMGGKDALMHSLMCLSAAGHKRALLGKPTYPGYLFRLRIAGFEFDFFEIQPDEDRMMAEIDHGLSGWPSTVLLLNFPNNPTGISVSRGFYQRLADLGAAAGDSVFVLNDFVYGEMTFADGRAESLLAHRASLTRAAEIFSLSKAYSVPGWRVGALAGDADLVAALARLKSQVDYGIFLPLQAAAAAGLNASEDLVLPQRQEYRERAEIVAAGLEELGFELFRPCAGCSVWAKLPGVHGSARDFCLDLLTAEGIFLLPGECFGKEYAGFVRVALVAPADRLRDMLARVSAHLQRQAL